MLSLSLTMQEQPYLEQPSRPEEPLPSARREAFSLLIIVICAALVTTFLALFIFRTYQVEGPSMQNTLNNGDKLIIWKVPRTWAKITGHAYIPARGDVIVFNESGLSTYGQQDNKQLIKRVIGLPGDHLIVSGGNVTIYNQAHPSGFDPDKTMGYHIVNPTSGNVNIMLS